MPGHIGGVFQIQRFRLFHQRINNECLMPFRQFRADGLINFVPFAFRQNNSVHGLFPRRHFIDHRDIQIAVYGHRQGSRNRGCRHDQHVSVDALGSQCRSLNNAETVLLVNDNQPQFMKINTFLNQSVSADNDARLAVLNPAQGFAP